ncbi:hypothetical protein F0562_017920 [Nyssa sinensis]|uniref:DC1 domain-containing protein n=1 Tax=Nyssa sinensis TaxID=561372 RepID=A0A5J4ZBW7_9ASTE|nr:hypothetical protein F0562_017920 [Nyssa sinensis]
MSTKSLRKSGTFLLNKSPSMELANSPRTTTFLPVEFPTSPQPTLGKDISHFSHPHTLSQVLLPELFTCSGCKEYGAGTRFTCKHCDFQLHDFCALSPDQVLLKAHPLHGQHQLGLHSKPKTGGMLSSSCDVCGKPAKGYTFRCSACSFQMHPCCAMFSTEMSFLAHPHSLKLLPAMSTLSSGDPGFACAECKRRRSGRVYRCTVCDYHLHAVCAKSMINGLQAYGIKGVEKPSMLAAAARLASHVVIGFIGGLLEGIGEGVGEVIGQNIAKGKYTSGRRSG